MLKPLGEKARAAAHKLALAGSKRDDALRLIAQMLLSQQHTLLQANQLDMDAGADLNQALRDRLLLTEKRIADIAQAVEEIRALPDPVGELLWEDTRPNGLRLRRVAVPLGVIAVIFEARPNVTLDAAAMCLKSGNAVILRGGKEAIHTNTALTQLVRDALHQAGLPEDCVQLVTDTTRQSALELMRLDGYVDLLIPRGGKALIQSALQNATVPVLQTGEGVCHVYVDRQADIDMSRKVTFNAKVNRPSTCNAAECLLVHRDIAAEALPLIAADLMQAGVELRGDEAARALVPGMVPATQDDWGSEYNRLIMAVKVVADMDEAIAHIARYGTQHSEAIITKDQAAADRFLQEVDAAAVYHNASTRFTDGGEFGFGAEIGISTQRLHCRGPVGIRALCTSKFLVEGDGQTR